MELVRFRPILEVTLKLGLIFMALWLASELLRTVTRHWRESGDTVLRAVAKALVLVWAATFVLWPLLVPIGARNLHPDWDLVRMRAISAEEPDLGVEARRAKMERETGLAIGIFLSLVATALASRDFRSPREWARDFTKGLERSDARAEKLYEAFRAGVQAAQEGKTLSANPFSLVDWGRYRSWRAGWRLEMGSPSGGTGAHDHDS